MTPSFLQRGALLGMATLLLVGSLDAFVARQGSVQRRRKPAKYFASTETNGPDSTQLAAEWKQRMQGSPAEPTSFPPRTTTAMQSTEELLASKAIKPPVFHFFRENLAHEWAERNREVDHYMPQPAMAAHNPHAEPPPTTLPRGGSGSDISSGGSHFKNIGELAQEWAGMNREPSVSKNLRPRPVAAALDDLAISWMAANKDTDVFVDTPPMTAAKSSSIRSAPADPPAPPKGSRMMASAAPSMEDLTQAWIVANRNTDKFVGTPPMASAALSPIESIPTIPPAHPKGSMTAGPSMEELAQAWIVANRNTDKFVNTPPIGTTTTAIGKQPPLPAPVSETPHVSPSMEELGVAWIEVNHERDVIVQTRPVEAATAESPPAEMSTPMSATGPTYLSMEDLALAWSTVNQDTDSIAETPTLDAVVVSPTSPPIHAEAAPPLSLPAAPAPLVAPSKPQAVNWENLAKEWTAINADVGTVVEAPTTAGVEASGNALDSLVDSIDDSWKGVSEEMDEIKREAEETFVALQQMESEMNTMINTLQKREAAYEQKLLQMQKEASENQNRLQRQIHSMESEYERFKREAEERHTTTVRSAEKGEVFLKQQIADLRRSLEEKINFAKQESIRAQDFMQKYQETESCLTRAKEIHANDLAQTVEKLKPSAARLEDLRRVSATLRAVSQGSRDIMARMRQKLMA